MKERPALEGWGHDRYTTTRMFASIVGLAKGEYSLGGWSGETWLHGAEWGNCLCSVSGHHGDTEQGDRLIEELVRRQLHGTPASDPFLQCDLVAAVIRPLLRTALAHHETITMFLPKATAKWRSVAAP